MAKMRHNCLMKLNDYDYPCNLAHEKSIYIDLVIHIIGNLARI